MTAIAEAPRESKQPVLCKCCQTRVQVVCPKGCPDPAPGVIVRKHQRGLKRTYDPITCQPASGQKGCGKLFTPSGPRARLCPDCRPTKPRKPLNLVIPGNYRPGSY